MSVRELTRIRVRTADDAVLHLEGSRTGRDVLLLHGLGYASWAAKHVRLALDEELALWSLDNRGTGRSTRGRGDLSIDLLADDAALAIEALGRPAIVVGYSMGGYIAQLLALSRPDLVGQLILVGTSPGGAGAVPVPDRTRRFWLDAVDQTPEQYARRTMPLSFRDGWPQSHPDEYENVIQARLTYPTPSEIWREQYQACERFLQTGARTAQIAIPTLILHGGADRVLPPANGRAIASMLPTARYRELPGAGHLLHLEEPDTVAGEILRFVSPPFHDHGNTKE
ncbi:alpha/beta fold hydrolase [Herbiconiux ginsengi]|uniref:Pimeloyl-ACP methyl ester carboxylesterase n=1 Tax=Herbiconiux ginsengi TaxID=381665 RepID=A0A1H3KIF9_9MICO|nr:alpha/beta fold hydrolase [Herbiconiux ginsengi]SDY51906.1 Pimeloyl-ACP methyl ester carboxylesterase [Herbiconiux ginsengi]